MSRRADAIEAAVEEAAFGALGRIGLDLEGAAVRDAPIEEGTLRGSAESRVEAIAGGGAQVVVSFNTPYAARQHEELDWDHPRGGKARYLGDQLKARTPRYLTVIADAVRDAVRRAGGS